MHVLSTRGKGLHSLGVLLNVYIYMLTSLSKEGVVFFFHQVPFAITPKAYNNTYTGINLPSWKCHVNGAI